MSDISYIGSNVENLERKMAFNPISKVVLVIDNENTIEVGDNSGDTLTIKNPWGTLQMATNILSAVQGYVYKPFDATNAIMDLATDFHSFYNSCHVKGDDNGLMAARLKLVDSVRIVMAGILGMLKITAPEKM